MDVLRGCWPCARRRTLVLEARAPATPEPAPEREPTRAAPPPLPPSVVARLPSGARKPKCARSAHGTERRIETEHYRYRATRPARGGPWPVKVTPLSAAARYYTDAQGQGTAFTCPLPELPWHIAATERHLAAYWGHVLDTRREWD